MPIRIQFGGGARHTPAWLGGWVGRVVAGVLGALVLVGAVLFFTLFVAVAAVFVVGVAIRWWWAMRKLRRQGPRRGGQDGIDAEYQVIDVDVIEGSREID